MKPTCLNNFFKFNQGVHHPHMKALEASIKAMAEGEMVYKLAKPNQQDSMIRLRLATYEDLPQMVEMEGKAYQGYLAWDLKDFERDWKYNRNLVYLVLEKSNHSDYPLVGMITGRFVKDYSHISHLLLLLEYQGVGLGHSMLEYWLKASRYLGKKYTTLEVRESNSQAQKFYYQHDFMQIGKKNFYYDDGETALLLKRFL